MKQTSQENLILELGRDILIKDIVARLKECNDISLLDLILKLLKKSS